MKKRNKLPPSPLKIAHKPSESSKLKTSINDDKVGSVEGRVKINNNNEAIIKGRKIKKYVIAAGIALLLAVAVGVYIQKYSSFCFVWHEWVYPHYKNETQCIYIRDNIQKKTRLSTAGFRHVWQGYDTERKTNVALKELKCSDGCCGDKKAHFREIYLETQLSHPSIVPYVASCNLGPPYSFQIVSEFMEGGTLDTLRRGGGGSNMNTTALLFLMLQVAEGLDYLHNGLKDTLGTIIHDDLNTQQILFKDKTKTKLLITDFNLATIIPAGSKNAVRRYWWPQGFSWRWFAPEKLRLEYYYEAADIWSFGVIFYESLMGANSLANGWDVVDRKKYENEILNSEKNGWRPARPEKADIKDSEWNIVENCLQYFPEKRPTIGEVISMLKKAIHERTVVA